MQARGWPSEHRRVQQPKTIVVVGASDELTAHLRLLMRKAAADLSHPWVWGEESHADLVVVDPAEFAGHMARDRTMASGVPCAALVRDADDAAGAMVLQLPLKTRDVVQVLNTAAASAIDSSLISHNAEEFYVRALGEDIPVPASFGDYSVDIWGEHRLPPAPVQGLDEMLRKDKADTLSVVPQAPLIGVDVVPGDARSSRSEARAEATLDPAQGAGPRPEAQAAAQRIPTTEGLRQPLRAYLDGDLIWRPSQAKLEGAPALILDPKRRLYFSEGDLAELLPYFESPPPRQAWQPLTPEDREQVAALQGRPFSELLWLDAMLKSTGRLASHLDPGGSYRLKHRIAIDPGFRAHGAIADAMQQSARFNEITAASGARMEQVFDLVNAYDSIGAIEWVPRERLRTPPPVSAPEPPAKTGLIARLWPFGRR